MEVALGQRHRGIETDDGEQPRYIKDGLNHLLANGRIEVVELSGVVPWKASAVVAVIDIAGFAGPFVASAERDSGIGLFEIVIFNLDFDALVMRKIGTVKTVRRIRRLPA